MIDARSSVHPIHAECHGLEGYVELELDEEGAVSASAAEGGYLELATGRLSSGNPLYDREMRRRIDASSFPRISSTLLSLESAGGGSYRVRGELTFHGVTRPYEEEITITSIGGRRLELSGRHVFDVTEFGVSPPRIMLLRVYPDVAVTAELVAERSA